MYLKKDICIGEDSSNGDEEEDNKETLVKLSVTHVIKRDILVAIVPSISGTNNKAKGKKWW